MSPSENFLRVLNIFLTSQIDFVRHMFHRIHNKQVWESHRCSLIPTHQCQTPVRAKARSRQQNNGIDGEKAERHQLHNISLYGMPPASFAWTASAHGPPAVQQKVNENRWQRAGMECSKWDTVLT